MNFKNHLLSVFREVFIPHHRSIEFRAKIFAAMLLAKKKQTDEDYDAIKDIAGEIYPGDEQRIGVLVSIVKEYILKAKTYKGLNLDSLLKEIDRDIKNNKKYIFIEHISITRGISIHIYLKKDRNVIFL